MPGRITFKSQEYSNCRTTIPQSEILGYQLNEYQPLYSKTATDWKYEIIIHTTWKDFSFKYLDKETATRAYNRLDGAMNKATSGGLEVDLGGW